MNFSGCFLAIGYLTGALTAMTHKWLNRQLMLVVMIAMTATIIVFIPYYGKIQNLFIAGTIGGMGFGSWDCSNTFWLMEMWPKHQASIIQAQQFVFGLGTITSAIIMSQFVKGINTNGTEVTVKSRQDSLIIPFASIGSVQLISSIILLILFIVRRYKKSVDETSSIDKDNESNSKQSLPTILHPKVKLIMMALLFAFYTCAEQGYFFYSDTMFQYWKPVMTSSKSATVLATLAATYTIGRLLTAFISMRLKPDLIIVYHYVIIIISLIWLNVTHYSEVSIYLGTAFLGYGFSAMWPAMVSFAEHHIGLTDQSNAIMFGSAGLGPQLAAAVTVPLSLSKLYEETV
ncbi:hypothetical protein BLA29_002080 [Euroglyphus maynei]|uniref:Sodium-dependent glucose transporter 1-like protein n=1 Tax=Euroglyphus maynei TaxID=6958 RepID=A0A1Y3B5B2_EURMA|nr:hypothetical protein BLA29_002080 [Euroglyphus maynei]